MQDKHRLRKRKVKLKLGHIGKSYQQPELNFGLYEMVDIYYKGRACDRYKGHANQNREENGSKVYLSDNFLWMKTKVRDQ